MRKKRNAQRRVEDGPGSGHVRKQILDDAESRVVRTLLCASDLIPTSASGPRLMMIDLFFVSPPSRSGVYLLSSRHKEYKDVTNKRVGSGCET
jgi:hypothetical protein